MVVEIDGTEIAQIGTGCFIGDMACMLKGPASATSRLRDDGRYFQISSEALNRLSKDNPDLGAQLEFALAGDTQAKLIATNQLLQKELVRE